MASPTTKANDMVPRFSMLSDYAEQNKMLIKLVGRQEVRDA